MSSEKVWFSNIMNDMDMGWYDYNIHIEGKIDTRLILQYENFYTTEEKKNNETNYKESLNKYINLLEKFKNKKILAPEYTTDRFYKMPKNTFECQRSIFMGVGEWLFVNEIAAQILQQHNLGDTQLIKVDPYDAISNERIESEYTLYLLNIAETNEYCNLERSENIYWWENPSKRMIPKISPEIVNDGFLIDSITLDTGLDLWADSRLLNSFFISDSLKKALDEAGIAKEWLLTSCVVEG